MKHLSHFRSALFVCCLFFLAAACDLNDAAISDDRSERTPMSSLVLAADSEDSVTLSVIGNVDLLINDFICSYDFEAYESAEGAVHGRLRAVVRCADVRYEAIVTCMHQFSENTVGLFAVETRRDGDPADPGSGLFPGNGAYGWTVRDNGEGGEDLFTGIEELDPALAQAICVDPTSFGITEEVLEPFLQPIYRGYIRVN